jgi:hypothetical protein
MLDPGYLSPRVPDGHGWSNMAENSSFQEKEISLSFFFLSFVPRVAGFRSAGGSPSPMRQDKETPCDFSSAPRTDRELTHPEYQDSQWIPGQ